MSPWVRFQIAGFTGAIVTALTGVIIASLRISEINGIFVMAFVGSLCGFSAVMAARFEI